ncbi:hypothetical protein QFZ75_006823 [Streptomyces sp. V3I8]|nr:hypothetical protein [Streptomyces sp. V3I8]
MVPEHSDVTSGETTALALKILVAGGFGVGKTTLVGAVGVDRKVTTTVAMDFGRITIGSGLSLHPSGSGREALIRLVEQPDGCTPPGCSTRPADVRHRTCGTARVAPGVRAWCHARPVPRDSVGDRSLRENLLDRHAD